MANHNFCILRYVVGAAHRSDSGGVVRVFWPSILLVGMLVGNAASGCEPVARLTAFEGQVSIKPSGKVVRTSPGALPRGLCAGDEVYTFEGRAQLTDGRYSAVLDQHSVAAILGSAQTALNKGQALFEVSKRTAQSGVQVKTRLSVIGVKGTRFLVGDKEGAVSVVLDEGSVEVKSTQGPIGLYRESQVEKKPEQDFESFMREHQAGVAASQAEFEQYKVEIRREFVAYVESLMLEAGKELVTVGKMAVERDISRDARARIEALRQWPASRSPGGR